MNKFGVISAAGLLLALAGCGSDDPSAGEHEHECSDHGELHNDHCDCDPGYEPDPDDELSCVLVAEDDDPQRPAQQGRLLISDGAAGRVVVVDLKAGRVAATLATNGASRSYSSSGGDMGFAVQTGAGAVQVISPGLSYVDHGDHFDPVTSAPEVLSMPIVACDVPIHFVAHDEHAATFCDGDGILRVFDDTVASTDYEVTEFDSGRAHHGVGLVALGHVLLSMPNPKDEDDVLPVGVRALRFDGEEQFQFANCSLLHGEASTNEHVCFGCSDGVMCLSEGDDGEILSKKIASENPEEGVRVGSLVAKKSVMVGNWGDNLVTVEHASGTLEPISFGEPYLQFALTEDALHLILLADSGILYKLRLSDGEIVDSLELMPEFVREPGHGQLRPKFVLGSDVAYAIDPRHAEVFEIDLAAFELSPRQIELPEGEFHSLALVALPPE